MLALDHIVIAGTEIDLARVHTEETPIKAVKGGSHQEWGTYNYLAHFSNESYLEWLGVEDESKARQSNNPLIKHLIYSLDQEEEVAFQFALRTNQLDTFINHFNQHDIPYQGPFSGYREKPDGTELRWRMLFPDYDYRYEVLPFLIEWENAHSVSSLNNPQAITTINMGQSDIQKFRHIYQLKPRKLLKNRVLLQNSKIVFTPSGKLSFELD